ncbi:MAG TPA: hypothetical protein VJ961_03810 [Mariprofundaceae bacterium]|nr:hypothetical protein [Mariprofundaceae bacterium]
MFERMADIAGALVFSQFVEGSGDALVCGACRFQRSAFLVRGQGLSVCTVPGFDIAQYAETCGTFGE